MAHGCRTSQQRDDGMCIGGTGIATSEDGAGERFAVLLCLVVHALHMGGDGFLEPGGTLIRMRSLFEGRERLGRLGQAVEPRVLPRRGGALSRKVTPLLQRPPCSSRRP